MRSFVIRLLAAALVCVSPAAASTDKGVNSLYVTVEGQQLSYHDIIELTAMMLNVGFTHPIVKAASEMPPGWSYYYYAGKDEHGSPILWSTKIDDAKTLSDAQRTELEREYQAISIMLILSSGPTNNPFAHLYEQTKGDKDRLATLSTELVASMREMSTLVVKHSDDDRDWIFANVHAGMTRQRTYAMLQARGLSGPDNKPFPVKGPADVRLEGAFQPGCYFHRTITITFDPNNRVEKLDLSDPQPDCL